MSATNGGAGKRIVLLANNWVGAEVARVLREAGENVVGLVLHPGERRSFGEEIARDSGVAEASIFDGSRLREPAVREAIRSLRADIAVSALFGYVLRGELIESFPGGCVNIHTGLLPYNRGAHPNVWSIVEGTPAGVTIHYMDAGVDTGDIIAQREVSVEPVDTGERLYRKLERAAVELFAESWPVIRSGNAPRIPQALRGEGSAHLARELESLGEIDLDRTYTGRELVNILRARTFPPYRGAYFRADGRVVYMKLSLEYGEASRSGTEPPSSAMPAVARVAVEEER